jgi:hypothetical protein
MRTTTTMKTAAEAAERRIPTTITSTAARLEHLQALLASPAPRIGQPKEPLRVKPMSTRPKALLQGFMSVGKALRLQLCA